MKKLFLLTWLILSAVFLLLAGIELGMGISMWAKEPNINFWGPASITFTIIGIVSLISLIISIICLVKRTKYSQK